MPKISTGRKIIIKSLYCLQIIIEMESLPLQRVVLATLQFVHDKEKCNQSHLYIVLALALLIWYHYKAKGS